VLNLRTRVLLEAVAQAEGLEVGEEDLERAVAALAQAAGTTPAEYRAALERGGQGKALAGDILRRRAVDRMVELAVAVDADGNEIEFPASIEEAAPAEEAEADDMGDETPEAES
jgi:trigger factor